jgi:PKD repeat protein
MSRITHVLITVLTLIIAISAQSQTLAGRVYEGTTGTEPPTSTALSGVTVRLYGTNTLDENPLVYGTLITSTTTDAQGWYGLQVSGAFDYYNIVEIDPSGYTSDGATTPNNNADVQGDNWIQFDWTALEGTLTGNKFWDLPPEPQNNPPIADANGPYNGIVNQPVQFDGSGSYDPDSGDSIVSYEWDMDLDGQYDNATGVYPTWTWNTQTITLVKLRITDTHGATDTDSSLVQINAEQTPCTALFDADPLDGCAPLQVQFTDKSSNAQSWEWKFYDQGGKIAESTQQNPSVTFNYAGSYSVFLKITCSSGAVDSIYNSNLIVVMDCNEELDFGDAPDPSYPTLLASDGARHLIDPDVFLGNSIDSESDGQPTANGTGDDSDGNDDDDGIVFNGPLVRGVYTTFDATVSRDGNLGVWVDFNGNGSFADAGESMFNSDTTVQAGVNTWGIDVPAKAILGNTFARFRFSTRYGQSYDGLVADGEVEDYQVEISEESNQDNLDFGDAPDPSFPTLLSSNGARHKIKMNGPWLGNQNDSPDAEPDGQPSTNADGDDKDGNDDEHGFNYAPTQPMIPDTTYGVTLQYTASDTAYVNMWVDFNSNDSWADAGEQTLTDAIVYAPYTVFSTFINIPSSAIPGLTNVRFRISSQRGLSYIGLADDGEVEDYQVEIAEDGGGTGNITVVKAATPPDSSIIFNFIGDLGAFSLSPGDNKKEFKNLAAGNYTIIEQIPPGWLLGNYQITGDLDGGTTSDSSAASFSIDLDAGEDIAIVIYNYKPSEQDSLDFGDAPDPSYLTLLASNGARHIHSPGFHLGSKIDGENDGQPTMLADGDDNTSSDDEDGVLMSPFIAPGQSVPITINASAAGAVNAWIDFNVDGDWADAGEHIIPAMPVVAGANSFTINVPAGAQKGLSYARFRFSSLRQLSYDGLAPDGEVEDYAVEIKDPEDGSIKVIKEASPKDDTPFWMCAGIQGSFFGIFCFPLNDPSNNSFVILNPGDVKDIQESIVPGWQLTGISITGDADNGSTVDMSNRKVNIDFDPGEHIVITYKNKKTESDDRDFGDAPPSSQSASHMLGGPYLGTFGLSAPDADPGMQYSPQAQGDDFDGNDDENCIYNISPTWIPGGSFFIDLNVAANGASHITFAIWIDWNNDGDWEDSNELIYYYSDATTGWAPTFSILSLGSGKTIPPTTTPGLVFARVRIVEGKDVKLTPGGPFGPGEVEDHPIKIVDGDIPGPKGGRLGGYKWKDLDGNRVWDIGEPPLAGWTIWLDLNKNGVKDAGEPQTITDPFGFFNFTGLAANTFDVHEDIPPSWTQTFPGSPLFHSVVVDPKKPNTAIYFGNRQDGDPGDLDFGDAPPSYFQFAHASINANIMIGTFVDIESAAQPDPQALGDDNSGIDDEDGVSFLTPIQPGQTASIQIDLTNVSPNYNPWLWAWIDYNGNGNWIDFGELVINQAVVGGTMQTFSITVPPTAVPGISFARFYLIDTGPLPPNGSPFGEVEDYEFEIGEGGEIAIKWMQPALVNEEPDAPFTPFFMGWDEPSVYREAVIADDWYCKDPRPVTEIHWRGSYVDWREPEAPQDAPHAFKINIWTNSESKPVICPSKPDVNVWQWIVPREMLSEHVVGRDFFPGHMDEPDSCFQYSFIIPPPDWFYQEGDSTLYWLSIAAIYDVPPEFHHWGWLTRQRYFHNDAVRIIEPKEIEIGTNAEFTEPIAEMIDMVFMLITDEYSLDFDFGDAPAERYPTFMDQSGAHHFVDPAVRMGDDIDAEPDGQPTHMSDGDDNDGLDDGDGIQLITAMHPDMPAEVEIITSTNGFLNAWIDFNNNGFWGDPEDYIFSEEPLNAGYNIRVFHVPPQAFEGKVYARFRFSKEQYLPFFGLAMNGEVEDYVFDITTSVSENRDAQLPKQFYLYQNYPNPFNPTTRIEFDIKTGCHVDLAVFDVMGKQILKLVDGQKAAGRHESVFNASQLSSGIYYYRIKTGSYKKTRKMLLLK